jgi:hypothetical protein
MSRTETLRGLATVPKWRLRNATSGWKEQGRCGSLWLRGDDLVRGSYSEAGVGWTKGMRGRAPFWMDRYPLPTDRALLPCREIPIRRSRLAVLVEKSLTSAVDSETV